jgi:hypothetical protein
MFGVWVPLTLDVRSIKVEELGEKFDGRFSSYVNRFHERNDKSREELEHMSTMRVRSRGMHKFCQAATTHIPQHQDFARRAVHGGERWWLDLSYSEMPQTGLDWGKGGTG